MDVDLNNWYRCKIDKKEFKKLCKKSDWQGFKHMIIYFSALFFFGYLAYATWGTWWCYCFFSFMEIYGDVLMLSGMKLDIGLHLKVNFGMISSIILLVSWTTLNL